MTVTFPVFLLSLINTYLWLRYLRTIALAVSELRADTCIVHSENRKCTNKPENAQQLPQDDFKLKIMKTTEMTTALSLLCRSVGAFVTVVGAPPSPYPTSASSLSQKGGRRAYHKPIIRSFPSSSEGFNNDDNSFASQIEAERLKQLAKKLRAEAEAAEKKLEPARQNQRQQQVVADAAGKKEPLVEYFDLHDSCWELTYRFANEPQAKNDNQDEIQRIFFSGKLQLHFCSDGYTTNLSSKSSPFSSEQQAQVTIEKIWGWDVENSQDSLNYILFSADISLPPPIEKSERFYFQARVDGDGEDAALSLQDGSVTVKRDIIAPSGGWWGIIRADGILAEFRQVGEFKCRPIAKP